MQFLKSAIKLRLVMRNLNLVIFSTHASLKHPLGWKKAGETRRTEYEQSTMIGEGTYRAQNLKNVITKF